MLKINSILGTLLSQKTACMETEYLDGQEKTFHSIIRNCQHFWDSHSYWLTSSWQSNSIGSETRKQQSSPYQWLRKEWKDDMEILSSPFSAVLGTARVELQITQLHLWFHPLIHLWLELAFKAGLVTLVAPCMFSITTQTDLPGFNTCGSLYQAPGNNC